MSRDIPSFFVAAPFVLTRKEGSDARQELREPSVNQPLILGDLRTGIDNRVLNPFV